MNKKVLVITLALIVAFAGSAMASVSFGGKVTVTAEQKNFKVFQDTYTLSPKLEMTIKGSGKNVTTTTDVVETEVVDEETGEATIVLETVETSRTNWEIAADLGTDFGLGKYRLSLYDDFFNAYVWGNKHEFKKKATSFDLIAASSGKDETGHRARLEVPVLDLGTVTADFQGGNTVRLFAEGNVEGYDVGLAYARKGWAWDKVEEKSSATNVIVGQAGGAIPAGDLAINAKAAAGVTLGEDLGYAFGLSADTKLTDELKVEASVTNANDKWAGDAVKQRNTVLKAGATYEETAFQAKATVTQTFIADPNTTTANEKDKANVIDLGLLYRFSETLGYDDLFKNDKWYTNDAPAVKAFANVKDFGLGEVGVEVAAPVVEDMVWAKAYGKYGAYSIDNLKKQAETEGGAKLWLADSSNKDLTDAEKKSGVTEDEAKAKKYGANNPLGDKDTPMHAWEKIAENNFKVGADLYIAATSKLTVKPYAYYENLGKILTLGSKADYKIGASDTVLGLEVKKVTADDAQWTKAEELIKATISVSF